MPPARSTVGASALVIGLCLALAGCFATDQYPVISIENRTDITVDVYMVEVGASEGNRVVAGIEPGTSYPFSNIAEGCSDAEFVAKDESGAMVDRSATPLCRPSTWIIER